MITAIFTEKKTPMKTKFLSSPSFFRKMQLFVALSWTWMYDCGRGMKLACEVVNEEVGKLMGLEQA